MAAEGLFEPFQARGKTPWRFKAGIELMVSTIAGKIDVDGLDNLKEIPLNKPIVFAPSHITDNDVPIAMKVLVDKFDISIANISKFHTPEDELIFGYLSMKLVGKNNYFPIDYGRVKGEWTIGPVNIHNYEPMAKAMKDKGKAMIIAAHSPTYDHILPQRGGLGAVILTNMTDASIVPITVDVQVGQDQIGKPGASSTSKLIGKRPDARVFIGNPIDFPRLEGFDRWVEILKSKTHSLSPNDKQVLQYIKDGLRAQSDVVMETIALTLPKEKRGPWNNIEE